MLQAQPSQPAPAHYVAAPTPPMSTPGSPSTIAPTNTHTSTAMKISSNHHILIVTGPAGCGKSTVAKFLSERYGFVYIEGDDFHPPANIAKMAANIPLDDADRWDWLILLRDQALQALKQGAKGVVVTCSALKKKYRDVIRTARLYDEDPNADVHFVYLRASKETLLARVAARQGHYMKDAMVVSQLAALEEPDADEVNRLKDVSVIDVKGTPAEVQQLATVAVDGVLEEKDIK
ncbi:carbohydrate kinase [Aaosphaeria arxii CBS 175.79]|uniref:Gluconokinase n=1 Tax=Aaosphaeria arxii CBS 175.79 TaxID=1450172 RepID=A0A6A5Y1L4_9PLEO|nr:carbohydrate kinase [Aaosphaeria arxii CBS 175.79]KAF2018947.1 carbohydrate kinase [Aaosphaeria arxii CBS 175.79]